MKSFALLAIAILLSGCAGMNYAMENYNGIKVVDHTVRPSAGQPQTEEINGQTYEISKNYRIFDKPNENRLMITASLGDAAGQGLAEGFTFGLIDHSPPIIQYENAAIDYLKSTGRTCIATKSFLIAKPQYEVQYSCK